MAGLAMTCDSDVAAITENLPVIFVTGVDWDGHWVCEQQLASIISQTHDVIFIEQARTLLWFLHRGGDDISDRSKWSLFRQGIRRLGDRMYVVSPPFLLPFKYFPICHQINQALRRKWLRGVIEALGLQTPILITFDPASVGALKAADFACTVYYVNDAHDKRGLWFNPDRLVATREKELLEHVDLTLALSEQLATKSRALNVPTFVVRNGVDLQNYRAAAAQPEPAEFDEILHPRIGMVGMLDWRIDTKILEQLAVRRPEWSIVLTGPVEPLAEKSFATLRSLPNVHFLGSKKAADVPNYIRGLDVGLIPYRITEYTKQILSLKIFEHSALGVPSVATPMPALMPFDGLLRLAEDAPGFERAIADLLLSTTDLERAQLRKFAAENTWDRRAVEVMDIIGEWLDPVEKGNVFGSP